MAARCHWCLTFTTRQCFQRTSVMQNHVRREEGISTGGSILHHQRPSVLPKRFTDGTLILANAWIFSGCSCRELTQLNHSVRVHTEPCGGAPRNLIFRDRIRGQVHDRFMGFGRIRGLLLVLGFASNPRSAAYNPRSRRHGYYVPG